MTTIARIAATAIEIGMSVSSPSARLDVPTAVTKRISSVAYAVEEIASDEKTASAISLADALVLLLRARERPADEDALDEGHRPGLRGRRTRSAEFGTPEADAVPVRAH